MLGIQREDIFRLKMVTDPSLNQRGEVAFAVASIDEQQDRYISHLYLGGGSAMVRQLTFADCQSHSPTWSPDGSRLAFLSNRDDDKLQVWMLDLDGAEPRKVTAFPGGVSSLSWSPSGQELAVIAKTKNQSSSPDIEEIYPGDHRAKGAVRVFRRLQYKHATGMRDGNYARPYVIPAQGKSLPISEARPLHPPLEELDCQSPCWSPDGKQVAFIAAPSVDAQAQGNLEIFVAHLDSDKVRQLTAFAGSISALSWAPRGDTLIFTGHDNVRRSASNNRIFAVQIQGERNTPRCLTEHIDRSVGVSVLGDTRSPFASAVPNSGLAWSKDESQLFFLLTDGGRSYVAALHIASGQLEHVAGKEREAVLSFSRNESGQLVYLAESPLVPAELFFQGGNQTALPITSFNEELLSQRQLASPRELTIEADTQGNGPLGAWLLPPLGLDEKKKYPLLLQVHGGPHNAYGWSFFHEFHLLSAQGYFVLFTNPRGSQGYGEQACFDVVGDWGGCDYRDLMRALDVVAAEPAVDEERMGILGGSYGGYMTNWVVTQTDRFRAACTQRSVSNRMSMYGTSDIGYSFIEFESPGTPWDGWREQLDRSSIWYADRVNTPLLIIHSTADLRCPVEQAHQMFVALKRLDKDAEFVMYEGEDHGLSREGTPSRRSDRLERIVGWFDSYLRS